MTIPEGVYLTVDRHPLALLVPLDGVDGPALGGLNQAAQAGAGPEPGHEHQDCIEYSTVKYSTVQYRRPRQNCFYLFDGSVKMTVCPLQLLTFVKTF